MYNGVFDVFIFKLFLLLLQSIGEAYSVIVDTLHLSTTSFFPVVYEVEWGKSHMNDESKHSVSFAVGIIIFIAIFLTFY